MKVITRIKKNLFLILVILAYFVMFLMKPDMGILSVKNSGYYLKDMLMIMPVIFVLTALLDIWVPKGKIVKYLGKEAKTKGVILAFVLGSVSAGPIYAAFPMCIMLHKKGASIRNIVIILSSWAVIKIPMLLNEVKFLGPKFMIIRWILTVVAIVIFSWITDKIVKDKDFPVHEKLVSGLTINRDSCIGCSLCSKKYPEVFEMKDHKAYIKAKSEELDMQRVADVIDTCPVDSIKYTV